VIDDGDFVPLAFEPPDPEQILGIDEVGRPGVARMALRILGVELVLDVPAPDQPAQLTLLEDDAARLARVFLDRLPADRLELLAGDDRARPAGQRGDDRDLVAVLEATRSPRC